MQSEIEKLSEAIEHCIAFVCFSKRENIILGQTSKQDNICFESSNDYRSIADMLNIQSQCYHCGLQEYILGSIRKRAIVFINNLGPLQLLCESAATLEGIQ